MDAGRMKFVVTGVFLALCVALFTTACGGDDDGDTTDGAGATATSSRPPATEPPDEDASPATESPAVTLDACELITKVEVETAVGGTVRDGKPDALANLYTCTFGDPDSPVGSVAGVSVFVAESDDDAQEVYDLAKSNAADVAEVDGVGEEAYWDSILNTMQIVQGNYQVSVDVSSDEGRDQLAAATQIADLVLVRLP
jgi:hypothetical protein